MSGRTAVALAIAAAGVAAAAAAVVTQPAPSGAAKPDAATAEVEALRSRLAEAERQLALARARTAADFPRVGEAEPAPARDAGATATPVERAPPSGPPSAPLSEADARNLDAIRRQSGDAGSAEKLEGVYRRWVVQRDRLAERLRAGEIDPGTHAALQDAVYEDARAAAARDLGARGAGLLDAVTAGGEVGRPRPGVGSRPTVRPADPPSGTPRPPPGGAARAFRMRIASRQGERFRGELAVEDGAGLAGGLVLLEYDPALVRVDGFAPGAGLPAGFQLVTAFAPEKGRAVAIILPPFDPEHPRLPPGPAPLVEFEGDARARASIRARVELEADGRTVAGEGPALDVP